MHLRLLYFAPQSDALSDAPKKKGGENTPKLVCLSINQDNLRDWELFKKRYPTNTSRAILRLVMEDNREEFPTND